MTEIGLLAQAMIKFFICGFVGGLYSLAGLDIHGKGYKALRRYLGSLIICVALCVFAVLNKNLSLWYLLCYPLLIGAYCMGYGSEETWVKVLKRTLCAIAITCAFLPVVFVMGCWWLFGLQMLISIACSVVLGVKNPLHSAVEQFVIGALTIILVLFYV